MTYEAEGAAPKVRARVLGMFKQVFGGRYSRGAWAVATASYMAALAIMLIPPSTYLWTSTKPARDLYWLLLIVAALISSVGLVLVYAKRLQDQNIRGFWALPPLVAVPWALIWAASKCAEHASASDPTTDTDPYLAFALIAALVVILIVALRSPVDTDRFGRRSQTTDVLRLNRGPGVILSLAIAVVLGFSIYAGFFQDGIWVGRPERAYDTGDPTTTPGGGSTIASCAGAKGVSAIAQEARESGFVRDYIPGTWRLARIEDGTLDIQTSGKHGGVSYRADGFSIHPIGLRLSDDGSVAPEVTNFQIVAEAQSTANDVSTVATLSFIKRDYGYQVVIATSRVLGKGSMLVGLSGGHPRASSALMIADCYVIQAS